MSRSDGAGSRPKAKTKYRQNHDAERRFLIWSTLSVMLAGGAAAALFYADARIAVLVALAPAAVLVGIMALRAVHERRTLGLVLTWAGLIAPFIVAEQRSVVDLQGSLVTPLNVFQGVAPIVFLIAARLICGRRILPLRGCERALLGFGVVCMLSTMWSIQPLATRSAQHNCSPSTYC